MTTDKKPPAPESPPRAPALTADQCRTLALDGGESVEAALRILDERIHQAAKRGRRSAAYHAPHDVWAPEEILVAKLKERGFEVRCDGGSVMVFW